MIKTYLFTQQGTQEDISLDNWQSTVEEVCSLLWVDVREPSEDDYKTLVDKFGLRSIVVDSCNDPYRRPHLYEFSDQFYVNLTTIKTANRGNHSIKATELHVVAGGKFIITITKEKDSSAADLALNEYKESPGMCERGSIYAVYLLAEDLIETYFPVVEDLDDKADKLESDMLQKADQESLKKLFALKRQAFELRKLLGPQRDIFNELARRDFPFIQGENQVFFQDVYSRMLRIFDELDIIREILSGNLDIYLSMVSNRLNEVVKVLTIAATILMTLSFITGFYGMNFIHLPWLRSPNAFRNVTIFMVAITAGMLWWFKRRGWL